jgi:hypothetical protein
MKKIIIYSIFFILTFSINLFSECIDFSGTWLQCNNKVENLKCDNYFIKGILELFLQSLPGTCTVKDITQSQCNISIKSHYAPTGDNKSYSGSIEDNKITFNISENFSTLSYNYKHSINITNSYTASGTAKGSATFKDSYGATYTCNFTIYEDFFKVFFDNPTTVSNISKSYIDSLKSLKSGQWLLLGTSQPISNMNIFENALTVWSWKGNSWKIYSPVLSIQNILKSYNIPLLENISANSGFWVKF